MIRSEQSDESSTAPAFSLARIKGVLVAGVGRCARAATRSSSHAAYDGVTEALARAGRHAAGLAERLCVDGQHLMAEELREACEALDALVEHFGGRRRRAASATRENSATIR